MKFFFLVIVLSFSSIVWAQQKQVCFSIDDLPVVAYGMNDTSFQKDITEKLIASFTRNHIPAFGFVIVVKLNHKINILKKVTRFCSLSI